MKGTEAEKIGAEIKRRRRVADMMVTMHSALRDSYTRRATGLDALILSSSIAIAALAFVDPVLVEWLPWEIGVTRIVIGILAIVAFFASVMAWKVDWKGKADAHSRAASAYTKAKFGLEAIGGEGEERDLESVLMQYEETSRNSVAVPESKFLGLKSEHLMKALVSRVLDRYPAASVRLVMLRMRLHHNFEALRWKRRLSLPHSEEGRDGEQGA